MSGREAPVLLPAVGGFPFGRRPKVLLAVGELFVRARSARSQARSACVIAHRRRVSIRPKAEGFARCRRALCSGAHIARRGRVFIRPKAERSMLAVGELFVWARSARSQARSACVIARRRLALPPRGTKTSTPTAEGRWGAANLSAKPKVRRPPQALAAKPLVINNLEKNV